MNPAIGAATFADVYSAIADICPDVAAKLLEALEPVMVTVIAAVQNKATMPSKRQVQKRTILNAAGGTTSRRTRKGTKRTAESQPRHPAKKKDRNDDAVAVDIPSAEVKMFQDKIAQFTRSRAGILLALAHPNIPVKAAAVASLWEWITLNALTTYCSLRANDMQTTMQSMLGFMFSDGAELDTASLVKLSHLDFLSRSAFAHVCFTERTKIQRTVTNMNAEIVDQGLDSLSPVPLKDLLKEAVHKTGCVVPEDVTAADHFVQYANAGMLFKQFPCLRFIMDGSVKEIGKQSSKILDVICSSRGLQSALSMSSPFLGLNHVSCGSNSFTTGSWKAWKPSPVVLPKDQRSAVCSHDSFICEGPCLVCNATTFWFPGYCDSCCDVIYGVRVVFVDEDVGYGVFATRKLEKTWRIPYEGRICTMEAMQTMYGDLPYYGAQYGESIICADEYRCIASRVNHADADSNHGNMKMEFDERTARIMLVAMCEIEKGQELLYEYDSDTVFIQNPTFRDVLSRTSANDAVEVPIVKGPQPERDDERVSEISRMPSNQMNVPEADETATRVQGLLHIQKEHLSEIAGRLMKACEQIETPCNPRDFVAQVQAFDLAFKSAAVYKQAFVECETKGYLGATTVANVKMVTKLQ